MTKLAVAVAVAAATLNAAAADQRSTVPAKPADKVILHVLNRIGFGARPGDVERIRQQGLAAYIDRQLRPEAIDDQALVACLRAGADDVVLKSNLGRLSHAVREALERRTALRTLSPRQLEVLLLVVQGRTTREIGDELGLSLKTAETHRITMMKRLGIHDIAGLVRYAVRVRLIAPDG